jgi:hypothetical protein
VSEVLKAVEALERAREMVGVSKREAYGPPKVHFGRVAGLWNAYLVAKGSRVIKARDIPAMMVLYKLSREMESHSQDNVVDMAGYAALLEDLQDDKA